jgi:hypothetical protein
MCVFDVENHENIHYRAITRAIGSKYMGWFTLHQQN